MLTTFFLFTVFGLVSFPMVQEVTPAAVAKIATFVPQVVDSFTVLTDIQKKSLSAVVAVAVTYPAVYTAASFVEFILIPVVWVALLFSALATVPQTKDRATLLLKQYFPFALCILPVGSAAESTPALPLSPKKVAASNDDDNDAIQAEDIKKYE